MEKTRACERESESGEENCVWKSWTSGGPMPGMEEARPPAVEDHG